MVEFNNKIADKFKEGWIATEGDKPSLQEWADLLEEDEDFAAEFNRVFDNEDIAEADDEFDPDSFDHYLNMELSIDRGGEHPQFARVTKRLNSSLRITIHHECGHQD